MNSAQTSQAQLQGRWRCGREDGGFGASKERIRPKPPGTRVQIRPNPPQPIQPGKGDRNLSTPIQNAGNKCAGKEGLSSLDTVRPRPYTVR